MIGIVLVTAMTGAARADQMLQMPRPPATAETSTENPMMASVGAIALARYAGGRDLPIPNRGGSGCWSWRGWGSWGWGPWWGGGPRGYTYGIYAGGYTCFRWIN